MKELDKHHIVKYHNDLNKINFAGFNEKELNVFFSLVFLCKEKGDTTLIIPFADLKVLSNDLDKHKKRFLETLTTLNQKLLALNTQMRVGEIIYMFSLFKVFGINEKENVLIVQVNDIFSYILNDFIGSFTKFELENLVKLKSAYSKTLFRFLNQWRNLTKKSKIFTIEEFKKLIGVQAEYNRISSFDIYVLGQLRKDLSPIIPNLIIEKKKTGRKYTHIEITWGKDIVEYAENDIIDIEISEKLAEAFEKASHNRYIKPFLTKDNKIELIEYFEDEKILIKGLYFAYKKINKDFKRLSYLIKVMTTGAADTTPFKEIVTKNNKKESLNQNDYRQTTLDEDPRISQEKKENLVGKPEITEEKFEELYQKYLKDNNVEDRSFTRKCFAMPYDIIKKEDKKLKDEENIVEDLFNTATEKEQKKVYTADDIPEEKLLSKSGKKLVGGALKIRIQKILEEMNGE